MAALDDILTTSSPQGTKPKPIQVAPPPVDASMQGAANTIGPKPVEQRVTVTKPQSPTPSSVSSMVSTDVKPRLSYVQMYEAFNPNKPETDEERAKREKQEKREAIFSALGDGISALSNLFFTSRYAPNAYDPSKGMSAKAKERWDKLRQEREANRKAYQEGYMRAAAMDDANARDDRNWQHTLEREKIADKRYEIQAARDNAMADLNEKLRQHQITAAEYKAEQERIKAEYAEETEKLKQGNLRAGIGQKNAAAGASNARARYYDNGGTNGGRRGPTLQLEDDEPLHFGDDKDYDRTVMRLAPDYNVKTTVEEILEWGSEYDLQTKERKRVPKKTRTVKRDVKDIAADIEREAAKRKKSKSDNNTMPGVGGGNTSYTMPGVK